MNDAFELLIFLFVASMFCMAMWKVFDLTRTSIKKNKKAYDADLLDRLAQAFIDHKKETNRRLQNIETILAQESENARAALNKSQRASIEIDESFSKEENKNEDSKLSNNLRTKNE